MISHVTTGVKQFDSSFEFYSSLMNEPGLRLNF